MEDKIYVIGHKNPDTDSICAAIGYSQYKRELGLKNVFAARLGEINKETEFVLGYFGVKAPDLISTVKMQVRDVDIDPVVPISPDISIREAWNIMRGQGVKTLPVVDYDGKLVGICTLSNLTNSYMDISSNNLFSQSKTSLRNVVGTISGTVINKQEFDFSSTGKIIVAAMNIEEIESRVKPNDVVIAGDRNDVQEKSIECGAGCLIITGNHEVSSNVLALSEEKGCMLVSVPYDSFTTSRLISMSIPVSFVMSTSNIVSFDIEDYIDDIRDIMLDTRYRSYPVLSGDRVVGTISRYHLIKGNRKKVILVDHNERSQSVDGLEEAEILEIVDHHRIGDIQTTTPISVNCRPIGSTSTIVAQLYFDSGFPVPPKVAGLLCGAIISDTLLFKSPTSTRMDRDVAERLSRIAGFNINEFGNAMFKAGTSLSGKSAEEIFYQDFKEFTMGKKRVGISQVFTMDIEGINDIKEQLLKLMEDVRANRGYDFVMLMLTDIIKEGSEILFSGSREVISRAFNIQVGKNKVFLPGVVSRKKQVVPPVASVLNR